jgi:bifunctional enzyme CysN/CysC
MDRVGYAQSVFEDIRREYADYAAKLAARDLTFIPISALHGDNVVRRSANMPWYDGLPLLTHLETVHIAGDSNLVDLRFPVQYVLRPHADFRGYAGTVASGVLRVGDEVAVLPAGTVTRVSRIIGPDGDLAHAFPPQSVTVCLEDDVDVARGDMLAHPRNLPWLADEAEAMVIWMHDEPLRRDQPYLVKHTTRTVRATCAELAYRIDPDTLHRQPAEALGLNEIGRVRLRLRTPLLCDAYERNRQTGGFILIDPVHHFTVGAGLIIDRSHGYHAPRVHTEAAPKNLRRHDGAVTADDRARLLGQRPATLWLTGLSAAGKSTIAYALEQRLIAAGHACVVLDGDNLRHGLNRDLGFSPGDRAENIRRVAEVARLLNDAGLIVITAFISPYREDRARAGEIIGRERFVEVLVDAPLAECERRDPKGLYAKARAGEIAEFTGVSAPYEPPDAADLVLDTASADVPALVEQAWAALEARGVLTCEPAGDRDP